LAIPQGVSYQALLDLEKPEKYDEGDSKQSFRKQNFHSTGFGDKVAVGDISMSWSAWSTFNENLHCWTNSNGSWVSRPDIRPLFSKIYDNDVALASRVYSVCGPIKNRTSLDYVWEPESNCPPMIQSFSVEHVCRIMRGRTMIFIGILALCSS